MSTGIVHLIDDDEAIRDALAWLLRSHRIESRAWDSAESFLADYHVDMRGCLILDIRMSGMTGLELFEQLLDRGCAMPVIFLTGHADVPLAVRTVKKGAFDFLEKPFSDGELAERVVAALGLDEQNHRLATSNASIDARLQSLTMREKEVMKRILGGQYNKVIAADLQIAMRTVEVHRARIFEKMNVRSAVELAQLLAGAQLD
ncbi:MAG: response regulator transcription factor [Rhodocyclaceae bacterium]|nr:response regulator transcription factor [Rhodocyclaceae bacterium]MBK6553580.1 response regulator transcription factor [Rhodocyclaceae bacterium]MBK9311143.1 response regulator transcription factor [Rhodocyclaceae bacterium]MBK9956637.1 response regulator transcription factor [Rhodocyclaceae bacterium]